MGEGQYECEIGNCHEYYTHVATLLTDTEWSSENTYDVSNDRILFLCKNHAERMKEEFRVFALSG
jgi:hypothetical protein